LWVLPYLRVLYVLPRATKFGVVTRMGACLGVSHAVVYCTTASRGLSAIAEFLVVSDIHEKIKSD